MSLFYFPFIVGQVDAWAWAGAEMLYVKGDYDALGWECGVSDTFCEKMYYFQWVCDVMIRGDFPLPQYL